MALNSPALGEVPEYDDQIQKCKHCGRTGHSESNCPHAPGSSGDDFFDELLDRKGSKDTGNGDSDDDSDGGGD